MRGPTGPTGVAGSAGSAGATGSTGLGGVPIGRNSYGYPDVDGSQTQFLLSYPSGITNPTDTSVIVYVDGMVVPPTGIQVSGIAYSNSYSIVGGYLVFTYAPAAGTYVEVVYFGGGPPGATGVAGPTGPTGIQGTTGPTGPTGVVSTTISSTPPSSPLAGYIWIDETTGIEYQYINDGPTGFAGWIEFSNQGITGATGPAGPIANGVILQVVSTFKNSAFTSSNPTTFVDVTGLTANITLSSATSRVWITSSISINGEASVSKAIVLLKRSINGGSYESVAFSPAEGNRPDSSGVGYYAEGNQIEHTTINYVDSPATTLPITYKWQITNQGSGAVYVNRSQSDLDARQGARAVSSITLAEVT